MAEDDHLESHYEDMVSGPEDYDPSPYSGDDDSDPEFWDDGEWLQNDEVVAEYRPGVWFRPDPDVIDVEDLPL